MNPPEWASLSDEELLERRIRGLGLRLQGSGLEPMVRQLNEELSAKGLAFHPPCFVGDEWFVPKGYPIIFIPFFLTHSRLRELELKMILEVEGDTPNAFMKLLRHEAGHAYSYAYRLYKKRKWQQTFGLASTEESDYYRPRPYSRSYVVHLDGWYAQSHPDEDFAETFAVWLTPGSDWRERYAGWKAIRKLEYLDELMHSIAGQSPVHQPEVRPGDYDCLNVKLKNYYARKQKLYEDLYPDLTDRDLQTLFTASADAPDSVNAAQFLRQNRSRILEAISTWGSGSKYRVNRLLSDLVQRCRRLNLYAHPNDPKLPLHIGSCLMALVMNHMFTGKFKRTK